MILAVILLLPGIGIALIPGVIGNVYMLLVAIGFAYLDDFANLTSVDLTILAVLTTIVIVVEFLAGVIGAKWGGAHWSSIFWGIVGLLVGTVLIPMPFVGSIIGMFIGTLVAEWYLSRDIARAHAAATGSFLGWLGGTVFKVIAAAAFFVLFIILAIL